MKRKNSSTLAQSRLCVCLIKIWPKNFKRGARSNMASRKKLYLEKLLGFEGQGGVHFPTVSKPGWKGVGERPSRRDDVVFHVVNDVFKISRVENYWGWKLLVINTFEKVNLRPIRLHNGCIKIALVLQIINETWECSEDRFWISRLSVGRINFCVSVNLVVLRWKTILRDYLTLLTRSKFAGYRICDKNKP